MREGDLASSIESEIRALAMLYEDQAVRDRIARDALDTLRLMSGTLKEGDSAKYLEVRQAVFRAFSRTEADYLLARWREAAKLAHEADAIQPAGVRGARRPSFLRTFGIYAVMWMRWAADSLLTSLAPAGMERRMSSDTLRAMVLISESEDGQDRRVRKELSEYAWRIASRRSSDSWSSMRMFAFKYHNDRQDLLSVFANARPSRDPARYFDLICYTAAVADVASAMSQKDLRRILMASTARRSFRDKCTVADVARKPRWKDAVDFPRC